MTNQRLWLFVPACRFEGEARESLVVGGRISLHALDSIVEACSLGIQQPSYIKSGSVFGAGHGDVRNDEIGLSIVSDKSKPSSKLRWGRARAGMQVGPILSTLCGPQ